MIEQIDNQQEFNFLVSAYMEAEPSVTTDVLRKAEQIHMLKHNNILFLVQQLNDEEVLVLFAKAMANGRLLKEHKQLLLDYFNVKLLHYHPLTKAHQRLYKRLYGYER